MDLIFDIEADNLLDDVTTVWCIVCREKDTEKVHTFEPDQIKEGLVFLSKADSLIGHNIIDYDLRVLKKLYDFEYTGKVVDTLVCSRTIWCDVRELDVALSKKNNFPLKLIGSHSLKAWGYRLGELKGDFNVGSESFAEYSQEMLQYCVQDTNVTAKLYSKILGKNFSQKALDLETEIHTLLLEQQEYGFPFDVESAKELWYKLGGKKPKSKQD